MTSRLPIEPLRAFVRAAELGSFKAAAESLHLTPGALSQRIGELERFFGHALFKRGARGVSLSSEGSALLKCAAGPIERIEQILNPPGRSPNRSTLRIHTVSSFANRWLIPRLGGFGRLLPSVDIEVETGTQLTDLTRSTGTIDLAIRYGPGIYDGLTAIELMRPRLVLVARPDLLDGLPPDSVAPALRSRRLLREKDQAEWRDWLDHFGCPEAEVRWGVVLEDDAALVSAALSGQGIASVRSFYVNDHIDNGALVALAGHRGSKNAYFLVGLATHFERPEVKAFTKWIRDEARSA